MLRRQKLGDHRRPSVARERDEGDAQVVAHERPTVGPNVSPDFADRHLRDFASHRAMHTFARGLTHGRQQKRDQDPR